MAPELCDGMKERAEGDHQQHHAAAISEPSTHAGNVPQRAGARHEVSAAAVCDWSRHRQARLNRPNAWPGERASATPRA
jgi:hypothetical protein